MRKLYTFLKWNIYVIWRIFELLLQKFINSFFVRFSKIVFSISLSISGCWIYSTKEGNFVKSFVLSYQLLCFCSIYTTFHFVADTIITLFVVQSQCLSSAINDQTFGIKREIIVVMWGCSLFCQHHIPTLLTEVVDITTIQHSLFENEGNNHSPCVPEYIHDLAWCEAGVMPVISVYCLLLAAPSPDNWALHNINQGSLDRINYINSQKWSSHKQQKHLYFVVTAGNVLKKGKNPIFYIVSYNVVFPIHIQIH